MRVSPRPKAFEYPTLTTQTKLKTSKIKSVLDGEYENTRDWIRRVIASTAFEHKDFLDREDERKSVLDWCQKLADYGVGSALFPKDYAGTENLGAFFASFEMLPYHSLNLTIKFGVQYGLFGGSVLNLGTEKHHKDILFECNTMKLPGCFAMTEIGHGSNVRQIETTATYDHQSRTFTIHSPTWSSGKIYIGNSARDGEMATVFAQLNVNGENKGVHAFLVPIRDPQKNLLPGIHIDDNGQKIGLNGVDNGMIWFDNVTIPKDALLDRFASIDDKGKWSSPIENDAERFFTMLGTLVGGRMSIAGTAVKAAQKALAIAVIYAHRRRQFGRGNRPETHIINYPSHQKRLGSGLATTIALSFAIQDLTATHTANEGQTTRDVETRAAALKAYATWESLAITQTCREACGGEGYLWHNQIGEIKADLDIFTTFEGDNTVLMQLVAKGLFAKLKDRFKSGEISTSKVMLRALRGQLRKVPVPGVSPNWHNLGYIGDLLLARENDVTLQLAQTMRKERKQGLRTHELMLEHQNAFIELGKYHAERLAYQSLTQRALQLEIEAKTKPEQAQIAVLFNNLTMAFGLERILRDSSWFFANHHLNKESHASAKQTLQHSHAIISDYSYDLIKAFAIPEPCLRAPIAQSEK